MLLRGLSSSSSAAAAVGRRLRRPRGMKRLELVLGKPGSGKTALVRDVMRGVRDGSPCHAVGSQIANRKSQINPCTRA